MSLLLLILLNLKIFLVGCVNVRSEQTHKHKPEKIYHLLDTYYVSVLCYTLSLSRV